MYMSFYYLGFGYIQFIYTSYAGFSRFLWNILVYFTNINKSQMRMCEYKGSTAEYNGQCSGILLGSELYRHLLIEIMIIKI